jgi:hypothetical protein
MILKRQSAEIVREHQPLDEGRIHGVTFDGKLVWFARDDELFAFDPASGLVVRKLSMPRADAGTAFDGEHLYQLAHGLVLVIRPGDGRVVRTLRAPGKGADSGMTCADGHLFIGQLHEAKIHKVDAKSGAVVKTLSSDRFVTGVTWVDGALWHAAAFDGKPAELRRLSTDGAVEEILEVPGGNISGIEGNRAGEFWCAAEQGKLRLVRRKRSA